MKTMAHGMDAGLCYTCLSCLTSAETGYGPPGTHHFTFAGFMQSIQRGCLLCNVFFEKFDGKEKMH
jgi:hypothetical protein